jgi:hypothetical protein
VCVSGVAVDETTPLCHLVHVEDCRNRDVRGGGVLGGGAVSVGIDLIMPRQRVFQNGFRSLVVMNAEIFIVEAP